jgi:hypothetical protein
LHKSLFVDTGTSAFIKMLPSFKMKANYRFHLVHTKKLQLSEYYGRRKKNREKLLTSGEADDLDIQEQGEVEACGEPPP